MPKNAKTKRSRSNLGKGTVINGFQTVYEAEPLSVRDEYVAPWSLPVEALTYEPRADDVTTQFKNGDKERKIYCNIELTEAEVGQLQGLKEESKKLQWLPSIAVMAGRFLSRARGDAKKAIGLMTNTQEWRSDYFKDGPVTDESVMEDLRHGIVYFTGRDRSLRPTLVIRANRIPQQWYKEKRVDKLIRILVFCMEYMLRYMVVPGRVENNCLIVDLKGLGISQVPIGALKDVYSVMSHHYIGRVYKFYICNLSTSLGMVAGAAKAMLTDRQKQKLCFLSSNDDLQKEFARHHLEEDLGGLRPKIETFFPFPLLAGPFEGGYANGPNPDSEKRADRALLPAGFKGRIWDPNLPKEDNIRLDYSPEAPEIFRRCRIPLPPDVLAIEEAAQKAKEAAEAAKAAELEKPKDQEDGQVSTNQMNGNDGSVLQPMFGAEDGIPHNKIAAAVEEDDEDGEESDEESVIQEVAVKNSGFFWCSPCMCSP